MFIIKFGYQNSVGNDLFEIHYADKVVEYHTPSGSYVMLYRYPTTTVGDVGSIVEDRIDLGGDYKPDNLFVENLAGKTVQRISCVKK